MNRATLQMAMADPKAVAADVAKRLGLTTTTLYAYANGDGSPKAAGQRSSIASPAELARSRSTPCNRPQSRDAGGYRSADRGDRDAQAAADLAAGTPSRAQAADGVHRQLGHRNASYAPQYARPPFREMEAAINEE